MCTKGFNKVFDRDSTVWSIDFGAWKHRNSKIYPSTNINRESTNIHQESTNMYRTFIGEPSDIYRKHVANLSNIHRMSIEVHRESTNIYQGSTNIHQGSTNIYRKSIGPLSKICALRTASAGIAKRSQFGAGGVGYQFRPTIAPSFLKPRKYG